MTGQLCVKYICTKTMTSNKWVEVNYKEIVKLSKYYTEDWRTIITYFYLWLDKDANWTKFSKLGHNDKMRWTNTWFRNNAKWPNSDFNKDNKVNDLDHEFDETWYEGEQSPINIEIGAESTSDSIKEWLIDIELNFTELQASRLITLKTIYITKLDMKDRVLFDMYFTDMLSMRDISKKINIPLASVHQMIVVLRKKIAACL